MAFNTDINTKIAQQAGILGAGQVAGGGKVSAALAASSPEQRREYERLRRQYQGGYAVNTPKQDSQIFLNTTGQMVNPNDFTYNQKTTNYEPVGGWGRGALETGKQPANTTYLQTALSNFNKNKNAPNAPVAQPQPVMTQPAPVVKPVAAVDPKLKVKGKKKNTPSGMLSRMLAQPKIKRPDRMDTTGMSFLDGLSDNQISSYLATKALYGRGDNRGDSDLFMNLLLRRTLDDSGNISNYQLTPQEQAYLGYLGVNTQSGGDAFLRGVERYQKNV